MLTPTVRNFRIIPSTVRRQIFNDNIERDKGRVPGIFKAAGGAGAGSVKISTRGGPGRPRPTLMLPVRAVGRRRGTVHSVMVLAYRLHRAVLPTVIVLTC
jgi:hypothetical protein